jgi:choline kinase
MTNALILVPEITKGMKSVGSKALLEIKKRLCVLEYQISAIKNIDKNIKITIATGFESEKINEIIVQHNNIDCVYNPEYKTTNQGSSIRLYLELYSSIDNLLIVSNGILFKNKCITKSMLNGISKVFLLDKERENFVLGCTKDNDLEYLFYDLPELWSECVYLNHEALTRIRNIITNSSEQLYLFELINKVMNSHIKIQKQYIDKRTIMKVMNQKDLIKAKVFV